MQLHDKFSYFLPGTNGKGVLLIHGLTGAPAEMKLVARRLNREGFSIYAPLLAGHGADKKVLVQTRWQDWLETVVQATQQFNKEVDGIFSAGICVGGKLGMLAAQQLPEVIKATAVYSPCFHYDGWNVPFYYPILSRNISWLSRIPLLDRMNFSETTLTGIKDPRLHRWMQSNSAEGVLDFFPGKSLVEMHRLGKRLKNELPKIATPTLILHAEEDDLSNPQNARIIANNIGAAHELQWIKNSYHMIHVDTQYKKVAQLTADFFNRTQYA